MPCEKPKKVLITVDGCGACATHKEILAPRIRSGEIEIARIEDDRAVALIEAAQNHPDFDKNTQGAPVALEVCSLDDVTPVMVEDWER